MPKRSENRFFKLDLRFFWRPSRVRQITVEDVLYHPISAGNHPAASTFQLRSTALILEHCRLWPRQAGQVFIPVEVAWEFRWGQTREPENPCTVPRMGIPSVWTRNWIRRRWGTGCWLVRVWGLKSGRKVKEAGRITAFREFPACSCGAAPHVHQWQRHATGFHHSVMCFE